jgi:hypothetical protein
MNADYWFLYWYVAPITALFAYYGNHTKHRWAPLTCVTFLFIIPSLAPPRPRGIDAVTATQITDTFLLATIVARESKKNVLCSWRFLRSTLTMVPFATFGSILLYVFSCKVGLLFYAPTALVVSLFSLDKVSNPMKSVGKKVPGGTELFFVAKAVSSVILSTSAFGLPSLLLFRKKNNYSLQDECTNNLAFPLLWILTLTVGVLNLWLAAVRFGTDSLPWSMITFAATGAALGKIFDSILPINYSPEVLYKVYLVFLSFLSATAFFYWRSVFSAS